MNHEELMAKWINTSEDEKMILGKPNFTCGNIAKRMREMGFLCDTKAEDEQALVIFTMWVFQKEDPENWIDNMNAFLKEQEIN